MSFLSALKSFFGLSSGPKALQPGDKMLICEDCNSQFVFDAGEQAFFKSKGFTEPKRCPKCRKKVRSRMRRRGRGRGHGNGNSGGGDNNNNQNRHQQHNQNQSNHHHHNNDRDRHHGRHHGRRHSVIDGDSPYADER